MPLGAMPGVKSLLDVVVCILITWPLDVVGSCHNRADFALSCITILHITHSSCRDGISVAKYNTSVLQVRYIY